MKFKVNNNEVFASTGGRPFDKKKPLIIFVHGSGLTHMTWVLQTRYFAFHGYNALAVDLPDELPVALFNEANIKTGSLNISGVKESEIYTGVDVSYIDPTNHYKRETVRIDTVDANDGSDRSVIENKLLL